MQRTLRRSKLRNHLYLAQDGKCAMCGAELSNGWHVDHVIPFSRGGETSLQNSQALCPACNQTKGANGDRDETKA